jgi:hypothetical protein
MTLLVLVLLAGGLWGVRRVCGSPLDVSGAARRGEIWLPAWLLEWKQQDDLAYPIHTGFARLLEATSCAPEAVGVQWIKAGWHARNDGELTVAVDGMLRAIARVPDLAKLDAWLCPHLHDSTDPADWPRVEAMRTAAATVSVACLPSAGGVAQPLAAEGVRH